MGQHVRLVDQRQVLARPGHRPLEGVADDPLHPERGVQADLGGDLVRRVLAQHAAVAGVGPSVPSRTQSMSIGPGPPAGWSRRRRASPGRRFTWWSSSKRSRSSSPRSRIPRRHARVADGAEQDRVVRPQLVEHRVGQELTGALPAGRTEVVGRGLDVRARPRAGPSGPRRRPPGRCRLQGSLPGAWFPTLGQPVGAATRASRRRAEPLARSAGGRTCWTPRPAPACPRRRR